MTKRAQPTYSSMYTLTHNIKLQEEIFPVWDSESVFMEFTGLLQLLYYDA